MKDYKRMYESMFDCDDIHEEYCKKCGKKWIAGDAGPGDEWYCNQEGNDADIWVVKPDKFGEFSPFKFIVCTCGFPLLISYHSESEWETQSTDRFITEKDFFDKYVRKSVSEYVKKPN